MMPLYVWVFSFRVQRWVVRRVNVTVDLWAGNWCGGGCGCFGAGKHGAFLGGSFLSIYTSRRAGLGIVLYTCVVLSG